MLKIYFLGLLTLLSAANGGGPDVHDVLACNAQAWVRAPDLAPSTITHGDVRIKISAECLDIQNVSLGLRFKERSFIKALHSREDVKWLTPKPPETGGFLDASIWATDPPRFANKSVQDTYEEVLTNQELWLVKEEERVVFETEVSLEPRDAVQSFSIFVPFTNFPPVLNPLRRWFIPTFGREVVEAEWIYEYFARISFANGTASELPAGYTDFRPLNDPYHVPDGFPVSVTAQLESSRHRGKRLTLIANYSVEITSGLSFLAGTKDNVVTAVVTRTGPARTFSAPLDIFACPTQNMSIKWAAEHDVPDFNEDFFPVPGTPIVLHTVSEDGQQALRPWDCYSPDRKVAVMMANSTLEEIQTNEIVTTKSAPFTILINVDDAHVATFETYYQTLASSLLITLDIPRAEDEYVDPDIPSGKPDFGRDLEFEDDEEAWLPSNMARMTTWNSFSGRVPAVVRPRREWAPSRRCPPTNTDMPMQEVMGCKQPPLIHYLATGARGPTFVDSSALLELLSQDLAKRELRAPFLSPIFTSPAKGEEAVYRYYHLVPGNKRLIYVGEAWAKKMAHKRKASSTI